MPSVTAAGTSNEQGRGACAATGMWRRRPGQTRPARRRRSPVPERTRSQTTRSSWLPSRVHGTAALSEQLGQQTRPLHDAHGGHSPAMDTTEYRRGIFGACGEPVTSEPALASRWMERGRIEEPGSSRGRGRGRRWRKITPAAATVRTSSPWLRVPARA